MTTKRYELNEAQRVKVSLLLPGKAGDPGRTASDNRPFTNRWPATCQPFAISTSKCRNFQTISSAVCLFLAIDQILHGQNHTSGRTTSKRANHRHLYRVSLLRKQCVTMPSAKAIIAIKLSRTNITAQTQPIRTFFIIGIIPL